ncbi:hypothetical protein L249_1552 [Ophiocordyceps polyrhachis-furcata BCC 54312]|uniref:TECPR1-like DysF domain-containing protein n=1 Tax=Ophiocordyceps polyrhachis-furcata BCC 54312 TaxID=1330021 RepID=A0A367L4E9_9HYPO|nr:hypothetical protein L249_1552 [Ophiocordyceps polyrhachis-furcata BCC 54312]
MDRTVMAESPPSEPSPSSGLRSGLAAIRERAGIQDRLVDKLLQQVIPLDPSEMTETKASPHAQRPGFNITTMSYNFRLFNARIGVVFRFQAKAERLLSWRRPTHTMSLLAVYSFVCLDPHLLPVLPLVVLLLGVLVPAFVARHPAPPRGTLSSEQGVGYSPRGPPLAPPAPTVRPPAKDLSRDFFRNMRDLQNSMADFSHAHDHIVKLVVPVTDFSNEALSSTVFLILVAAALVMALAAHVIPWRLIFFVGGWAMVLSQHPRLKQLLLQHRRHHRNQQQEDARSLLDRLTASDVILDSAPETREAEIFELQRADPDADAWEPWLFSPEPYDPLSPPRIAGHRPRGSRFFEDVLPPPGWHWSEKKWALDLWSREWVEDRIITGVEVETEGERWVYDMFDDRQARTGVVDYSQPPTAAAAAAAAAASKKPVDASAQPSWEEGDDGDGSSRRGEWRRRRWVRLVKRRAATPPTAS